MMQRMMRQMSELTARIAKIETTSTLTPAEPTPTPAVDATPPPAMSAPPRELKGLKDPDAFDGTRSQYLPWKYQIKAKLRSEPRRFHTSQLAIDYTFSRTTGDARARVFPWVSIHAASSTLDEFSDILMKLLRTHIWLKLRGTSSRTCGRKHTTCAILCRTLTRKLSRLVSLTTRS
ncbi:hypothetical protein P3342_007473 [Pyrenophora teres f. teres]|nr:hypothetical protein P3342_007473 [Pyrenophora teres f. teres]